MAFHFSMLLILSASWYASPTGTGDGTTGDPWSLNVALTNAVIAPGDTLYLLGGTYTGPFTSTLSGTSGDCVTIRPASNLRVILSDGSLGTLLMDLPASSTSVPNVPISGSELWPGTATIQAGSEILYPLIKNGTNYNIQRGWSGTTPIAHSSGEQVYPIADTLTHSGSYVVFRDFEITSVMTTNRVVGTSRHIGTGLNLLSPGHGNKALGLLIYNVGHPGIGYWDQGSGAEINGCILWGNGFYDNDGAWTRGAGIYSQNESGMATIKNVISFRNFTYGAKVYGETGPVKDFQFVGNIVFDNANGNNPQLEGTSGSSATSNVWFNGNQVLGNISLAYVSTGNSSQHVVNNVLVQSAMKTLEQVDSVYTNNTIFNMRGVVVSELSTAENGYVSSLLPKAALNILWDYNAWHTGTGSSDNAWRLATMDGASGWVTFTNWQAYSGFDLHSTITTNWPTDYLSVTVQALDYDANRWHIAVVNTDTDLTGTAVNLASSCGFSAGQYYRLRDAQNYFAPIAQGFYGGGTITLPLNLTNVSTINGTLTHMTNEHTNVKNPGLFNAFVLERITGMGRAESVRAGQIRGK